MNAIRIAGKFIHEWIHEFPLLKNVISTQEVFWWNANKKHVVDAMSQIVFRESDVLEARDRMFRFAPYIAKVFPETQKTNGIIESPVVEISNMKSVMMEQFDQNIPGKLLLKCDHELPIAGSIKARGGIYEVLKHAEDLAVSHKLLSVVSDYSELDNEKMRDFFAGFSITVGSTGNLGLSIGIMGSKLGFHVTVHMSVNAKAWKKNLLKSKGVTVVEHSSDYGKAVEEGRKQAAQEPNNYFIDDENSADLFLGYAVAAYRLKQQLQDMNVQVDEDHPLFVYLPCGVGGAPGGVTFGLKLMYGDHVHCFFAEPTHSPGMLIGQMTGLHDMVSVQDFGIDNITEADGLAVGRPSRLVGKTVESIISGVYTISDEKLFALLSWLIDSENIRLEPSAAAGLWGPVVLFNSIGGQSYLEENHLINKMDKATHVSWATGGNLVPPDIMRSYYQKGFQCRSEMK